MTHRETEHFYPHPFDDYDDEDDICPKCGEDTVNGHCRDCDDESLALIVD